MPRLKVRPFSPVPGCYRLFRIERSRGRSGNTSPPLRSPKAITVICFQQRLRFGSSFSIPRRKLNLCSECMYGLRFVQLNNRGDPRRMYSLRQLAVYNKEDVGRNLATWLLVAPPPNLTIAFNEYFEMQNTEALVNPFEVHILLFNFAVSSWRPYLVHLAEEIHQHVSFIPHCDKQNSPCKGKHSPPGRSCRTWTNQSQ